MKCNPGLSPNDWYGGRGQVTVSVRPISATARGYHGHAGVPQIEFKAEYEARKQGVDHICQVRYSIDGWKNSTVVPAKFDRLVNGYERWTVSVGLSNATASGAFLHVFTCRDLGVATRVYLTPTPPSTSVSWVDSCGLELSTPVNVTPLTN